LYDVTFLNTILLIAMPHLLIAMPLYLVARCFIIKWHDTLSVNLMMFYFMSFCIMP